MAEDIRLINALDNITTSCSNGQAIMFYSCDYLLFFRVLIFDAKERCPWDLCQDVGKWSDFIMQITRGPICILYIMKGDNLLTLPWFFANFGIYKPYNFKIAQRPETTYITECMYPSGKGPAYSGPIRWGLFIAGPLR